MKILHTSDWHLGVSADQSPRHEEHDRFLDWLIELIIERDVDVLLHGGDTFHYVQPSAKCLAQYYGFLSRCARETNLRKIVVTGGNHDSASRLDAPSPILESLGVHVVGTMSGNTETWERAICPIMGPDGQVECVAVAVPYIHESRLGVVSSGRTPRQVRDAVVEKFSDLYVSLADMARKLYPGVPVVATGHLTCYPTGVGHVEGDFATPLHMYNLGSMPPEVFSLGYNYVGLGHIHRMFDIPGPNAWYPGSPIPTDIIEARSQRYVLMVEVDPERPELQSPVEKIEVPEWRSVFELTGGLDEVVTGIKNLEWEADLPAYVYVDLEVDQPLHAGMDALDEALATFDTDQRPRIIGYKETLTGHHDAINQSDLARVRLAELSPSQVFERLYKVKHEAEPTRDIMAAFESLLSNDNATP